MRWEDERYVRVYTRDTAEWLALGWEAQALLLLLLRKADRAGILQTGKAGVRGVAALAGMPLEVVQEALPVLLDDGCLRAMDGGGYVFPNFLAAQEARSSDAQRKREQRARDRDKAVAGGATGSVTGLDAEAAMSRAAGQISGHESRHGVTCESRTVTDVTESVTPSRTVPCRAGPSRTVPTSSATVAPVAQASLLEAPPPLPAKKPRKPAEGPNAELWRALEAEYEARMGAKYASGNGGADASTVAWLLANTTPSEAVRRWGLLLEWSKGGFPNVAGFVALRSNWNAPQVVGLPVHGRPAGQRADGSAGRGSEGRECHGCGEHGGGGLSGNSTFLGYRCGCLNAWQDTGLPYTDAEEWARNRRAGRAA